MKLRKRIRKLIQATPIEGRVIAVIRDELYAVFISKKTAKILTKLIMNEWRKSRG
jgi:hypothetical protein